MVSLFQRNVRGNLRLHEDQDEDQESRNTAGAHHPNRELFLFSHRVDSPASFFGIGDFNTFWHNQFLQEKKEKVKYPVPISADV